MWMKKRKKTIAGVMTAVLLVLCFFCSGADGPGTKETAFSEETLQSAKAHTEAAPSAGNQEEINPKETESEETESEETESAETEAAEAESEEKKEEKAESGKTEWNLNLISPMLTPKAGGAKDIVVTTPETFFAFGGYRSVILSPDGQISDGQGISTIPLHFHYGSDGNTAFCLGVNLANPDAEVTYQEADLGESYGDKLEQVSAIVQNSILKFSDDRTENALPEAWRDFSYEEAEYTAQLAIWKTLLGRPGNEPEMDGKGWFNDAWLYQNVYFPRMENLTGGKDIKGFYEYLLRTRTVAEPTAQVTAGEPVYADGYFKIPISIQTAEASAGTDVMFYSISGEPKLILSDQTEANLSYDEAAGAWRYSSGAVIQETMTLVLSAKENDEKTISCNVYAKSNAVSSNLVYLIPSASHYQNLIKVEPKEVKTAEGSGDIHLPKVTAAAELRKVEKGTGLPVPGVEFHIWSDNGWDQRMTTDETGICRLEDLLPGTYQYQEEKAEGYVTNREVFSFSVDEHGTVTGQIGNGEQPYLVENLRYCDLTVVKKIKKEDIVWAHGNPAFLFAVSGEDLAGVRHTYYGSIAFTKDDENLEPDADGWIFLSYTFRNIPMGEAYAVEEIRSNRYLLTDVTSPDGNVTVAKKENPLYDSQKEFSDFFEIRVNLKEKPTGSSIVFQNEKIRDDDYSHTSMAENKIPVGQTS